MDSLSLLKTSLEKLPKFNPEVIKTPDQQEPYDALSDRFIRAVETYLKFFRSYERFMFGEASDTIRDLLNRMEKLEIISETRKWMEMWDARNRIVHDYLPEQEKELYDLIMDDYGREIRSVEAKIKTLPLRESGDAD